jgi:RNA polymerase sigma-70 factor (sigma-E family)
VASDEQYVEFVRARTSALLRTARLLTAGDGQAAEDLVQTAVTQGFVKRGRIRDAAAIEAYVRRILVHAAIRRSREGWRRVVDLIEPDGQDSGSDEVGGVADRLVVLAALRALPSRQRAVIVLRYYDDLSEAQIAAALGCSPGAVKSHSSRALKTLRRLLGPHFTPAPESTGQGSSHDA